MLRTCLLYGYYDYARHLLAEAVRATLVPSDLARELDAGMTAMAPAAGQRWATVSSALLGNHDGEGLFDYEFAY